MIVFKIYICEKCGFSAWTIEYIKETNCNKCGAKVFTKTQEKKGNTMSAFKKIDSS